MRIFVSAAEISSDLQAEKILKALNSLYSDEPIEWFGIGGPAIRSLPGFRTLAEAESMRAMGFTEVLSKIRYFRQIQNKIVEELDQNPPDLILTFDYPDFHFSLMRKLARKAWFQKSLRICGIPPKVWVWRKNRVERIREWYSGVWVIFPFEKNFYEDLGIPVIYEGNPLISDLFRNPAPKEPVVSDGVVRLAVLPGSRESELKHHLPIVSPTLVQLAQLSGLKILAEVPIPTGVDRERIEAELVSSEQVSYRFFQDGANEVLARNSLGLIKSGTSTLEAAVLGCVPVIFYRLNRVSEWIYKGIVRYLGPVGLPNILLGIRNREEAVFPEYLGPMARPALLALGLHHLIEDSQELEKLKKEGESLKVSLVPSGEVPKSIARKIQMWISRPPVGSIQRERHFGIALVSFAWSFLNGLRRLFYRNPEKLPAKSILIGNLQAGGAGKTPIVIAFAKEAIQRGYRVGVVSRGYGGRYAEKVRVLREGDDPALVGDEPAEILKSVPGVKIALSRDRKLAARALVREGVNLLVSDDGFQNLRFQTDVVVLVVTDAARSEMVYRDFDRVAARADFRVQVKGNPTQRYSSVERFEWEVSDLPKGPIWVWTAIADPKELIHFYEERGVWIEKTLVRPDHAVPDLDEVKNLMAKARSAGARLAITQKDSVKFPAHLRDQCFILKRTLKVEGRFEEWFRRLT